VAEQLANRVLPSKGVLMVDVPTPVWIAAFSVVAAPVIAWSFRTVREANRVVTAAARYVTTIAAQDECILALELKVKTLTVLMDTAAANHLAEMNKALRRIDDLEMIVKQWRIVQDVQDRRAIRHEAREIHGEARDDAADMRQHERADRSEAREVAAAAREVKQEARASGEST
jgi:hypothetical protein